MSDLGPQAKDGVNVGKDQTTQFSLDFKNTVQDRSKDFRNTMKTNIIPVQEVHRDKIESAIDNINDIIAPQIKSANLKSTKAAMLDRLYKKINIYFHKHTECFN
jgi:hypothetical protein